MENIPSYVSKIGFGSPERGEDAQAYNGLLAQLSHSLQPLDAFGEQLVREITDATWDIRRYRWAKMTLIADWLANELGKALGEEYRELLDEFATGDPAATAKVEQLMAKYKLAMGTAIDRGLFDALEGIERIDRACETAETRRKMLLREMDRRRSILAKRVETASEQTIP
jgi:hypothetical protein